MGKIRTETRLPIKLPSNKGGSASILKDETWHMENKRREVEKEGHRLLGAKVHEKEHQEPQQSLGSEGELQNDIKEHPWMNNQRFDGIDPNENPVPPLNTDARREFDNKLREQQLELQHRLGLAPNFSSTPTPELKR